MADKLVYQIPDTKPPTELQAEVGEIIAAAADLTSPTKRINYLGAAARLSLDHGDYWNFLRIALPTWVTHPMAGFHQVAWDWAMEITPESRPRPLVACWARGSGKSATLQLITVVLALRQARSYGLYVGLNYQSTSDKVSAIGEIIQSPIIAAGWPEVAKIYETATGQKRDWRRSRIRTASGFTLDAFGMDHVIRGTRVDEERPDIMIIDDIETENDTPRMTNKRREGLTKGIINAGADNATTVFLQNRIHAQSLMAEQLDGTADWLNRRIAIGPVPQVADMVIETNPQPTDTKPRFNIISGTPTWQGLDLETSNYELNDAGLYAFMSEKQHEDFEAEGNLFPSSYWKYNNIDPHNQPWPHICRSWDLASTESDTADWTAGALMGLNTDTHPEILHMSRFRKEVRGVEDQILNDAHDDWKDFGRKIPIVIERQPAGGKGWMVQFERILKGFPIYFMDPSTSKTVRAEPFASELQRGHVTANRFIFGDRWVGSLVREFAAFPDGRYDDQVDAVTQGYNWLTGRVRRTSSGRLGTGASRTNTSR